MRVGRRLAGCFDRFARASKHLAQLVGANDGHVDVFVCIAENTACFTSHPDVRSKLDRSQLLVAIHLNEHIRWAKWLLIVHCCCRTLDSIKSVLRGLHSNLSILYKVRNQLQ